MIPVEFQGITLSLHEFWLRDHCRCKECYNYDTFQRRYHLLELPENIRAKNIEYSPNGQSLLIQCTKDIFLVIFINYIYFLYQFRVRWSLLRLQSGFYIPKSTTFIS